ncbi:MAG: ATP-binding protein, partial [Candidatus Promineifilaceae bacterium]
AVFRGGRSLEAIEAVCAQGLPIDALDGLASLVDKDLVQQKELAGGEARFVLLEMIHAYARELLQAGGEAEQMRRRHAAYFVALAERASPELRRAGYDAWCRRFELELDNLRAVLEWALGPGDLSLGVRLAAALGLFWYGKGHHAEGLRWTQALLARLDEAPLAQRPPFLISAGHMAWMVDLGRAQGLFSQALALSRQLEDKLQSAWALTFLGYARQREPEAALALAEEGLALFRELDDQPGIAQTLNVIGEVARLSGEDGRARRAYEACLAVCQQTGEARRIGYMYNNLTYIAQHEGDHEQALELARRSALLARERQDRFDLAVALLPSAESVAALGRPGLAARILAAAEAELEGMGAFHQPSDRPEYERVAAAVRARLDPAAFEAAASQGRALGLEAAAAALLAEAG